MSDKPITRSFVKDELFFEISWSDAFVEIVRGRVGKSGRATEKAFASVAERDAFVADQIARATKGGYVECDPAQLSTPEIIDEFQRTVEALAKKLARTAWIPKLLAGDDKHPLVSKLGGSPYRPENDDGLECGRCGKDMTLYLQLLRADVPPAWRRVFASDLVQLFMCDSECQANYGWAAFAPSTCARHVADDTAHAARAHHAEPYPEQWIVGWDERVDYPATEDIRLEVPDADSLEVGEEFRERGDVTLAGEKLGGWPCFIQAAERPTCKCGTTMEPFFQIDSNRALPTGFGDTGVGWLSSCSKCLALTFTWQCC